ncbi:TPA: hypothetical protein MIH13_27955 [Klebsiella pneumoniae]|nr:hypothetical protein [Klebsiella pneumoniae]
MKMGGFPHGTGNRQSGLIPTRHRRPARWADFHTAPAPVRWADSHTTAAPGKVGRFPHDSVARQGGPIPISTCM